MEKLNRQKPAHGIYESLDERPSTKYLFFFKLQKKNQRIRQNQYNAQL